MQLGQHRGGEIVTVFAGGAAYTATGASGHTWQGDAFYGGLIGLLVLFAAIALLRGPLDRDPWPVAARLVVAEAERINRRLALRMASARPNTSRPQSLACDIGVRKKPSVARGPKLIMEMRQPHSTITSGVRQLIVEALEVDGNEMAMTANPCESENDRRTECSQLTAGTGGNGTRSARIAA